MALQIGHISGGRFVLNLVNAWNKAEFERPGPPFPAHDDRYAYGRAWIGLVDGAAGHVRVYRDWWFTQGHHAPAR